LELERFRVKPGDFIVSCSGTIGCIYRIPNGAPEGVINQALLKISLDPGKVDGRFFLAVVRSASFQERIKENSHGGAMHNLVGMEVFRETQFQHPPTKGEQEAIVKALSDADTLIESLEHLLAKKSQLKQGAMQELLTCKKRLPGFSGEWEVKQLGDVGEIAGAGVDKKIMPDEVQVRLVNYMDVYLKDFIYASDLDHWVTAPPHQARRCAVQEGDVFFTPSSETRDDIGSSAVAM